jgi:SNF2 family DNA or RNA helicase
MKLTIRYKESTVQGETTASDDLPSVIWNRVKEAARISDADAEFSSTTILMPWSSTLNLIREIAPLQRFGDWRFDISPGDEATRQRIVRFVEDLKSVAAIRGTQKLAISEEHIQPRLRELGFERDLKWHQLRNIARLISLPNGADFSVPGAGKTTVAYAVHLLTKGPTTRLLVIAPKNAFGAWDEIIRSVMGADAPGGASQPFIRVTSGSLTRLELEAQHLLINYDLAHRMLGELSLLLSRYPFHVVLDESHRIKAGELSLRGTAILKLSTLPVRKDILSGTPAPNSQRDLEPQLLFLWPGQTIATEVALAESPRAILSNLYVRTTKQDLGLPKAVRHFYHVPMGDAQLALYAALKGVVLDRLRTYARAPAMEQIRSRRCVVYLLEASSNPSATVRAIRDREGEVPNEVGLSRFYSAVEDAGDSNKLLKAVELARELSSNDRKAVIWTMFLANIARLEELLKDLSPVVLHGGVPTGDYLDPSTREGKIQRFHTDASCRVVIANPAAASEGISLHHASHDAIYLDRSYNAAHYLQSVDRIHRLGLEDDVETRIHILQSVTPMGLASIDHAVSKSLARKIRTLELILDDPDLHELALDEEEAQLPVDQDITLADVEELIETLMSERIPAEEDQV